MTFSFHGTPIHTSGVGVAIGLAVHMASNKTKLVHHYFIGASQVEAELTKVSQAKQEVVAEMQKLQENFAQLRQDKASQELSAMMDVHLLLLQDEALESGVKHWIVSRHYNAQWALTTHLEVIAAQFDEMQDSYMRERKADFEQVVERLLLQLQGLSRTRAISAMDGLHRSDAPLILITHDLSPSDMLQFKSSEYIAFVTDVGGGTSHTAIVARSLGIPAVVGTKNASQLVRQDDWVIVDADAGVVIVNPSQGMLEEYQVRIKKAKLGWAEVVDYRHATIFAQDGVQIRVMANIELPSDAQLALDAGAEGIGLFRTEFLFMGCRVLPTEDEQYAAYAQVMQTMQGLPVTIRTIDIGADKLLGGQVARLTEQATSYTQANPALGLRAIRWCLAAPEMFKTQLKALLRAAVHGRIDVLIPMLAHESEIKKCKLFVEQAREELTNQGVVFGDIRLGAMIEVPAAALIAPTFVSNFDFLSIGTNDLIQYTLAVDRTDASVAHLYDPWHPAVQFLIGNVIRECVVHGMPISLCGEMAGDVMHTKSLLDMGLRTFSMHPKQIGSFKKAASLPNR
jgi:phosphoenolpyruvate-protein phosphotransferase (PTS system enzyme I)